MPISGKILELLSQKVRASPLMLAQELREMKLLTAKESTAAKLVRNALVVLLELGLVNVEGRGVYSLTALGKKFYETEVKKTLTKSN